MPNPMPDSARTESFGKCPICGDWCFLRGHKCPPRWEVVVADDPEDTRTVYARDAEEAAEVFANLWDDGTLCTGGEELDVIVKSAADPDDEGTFFVVTCEMVPHYIVDEGVDHIGEE